MCRPKAGTFLLVDQAKFAPAPRKTPLPQNGASLARKDIDSPDSRTLFFRPFNPLRMIMKLVTIALTALSAKPD